MKKWAGSILAISIAGAALAAEKTVSTSESSPRISPRVFSDEAGQKAIAARKVKMQEILKQREENNKLADAVRSATNSVEREALVQQLKTKLNEDAEKMMDLHRERLVQFEGKRAEIIDSIANDEKALLAQQEQIGKTSQLYKEMTEKALSNTPKSVPVELLKKTEEKQKTLIERKALAEQVLQRDRDELRQIDQETANLKERIASDPKVRTQRIDEQLRMLTASSGNK